VDSHAAANDHYILISERGKSAAEIEMVFSGIVIKQANCLLMRPKDRKRTLDNRYREWVVFRVECDFERYPDSMI
jgi:hypothetical protein